MAVELPRGLTLYFCRHGETEANVAHRFQGDHTDTPLTPKGRTQCEAVAKILKRDLQNFSDYRYVSSPMPRARASMEIIRKELNLHPDGYVADERLREIELGAWDGLTDEEAKALDPEMFARRGNDKWHVRVPGGGENYADVAARVTAWLGDLRTDTFAVSHGAATRILRGLFAGLSWQDMSALDEPQGVVFRVTGRQVVRLAP